MPLTIIDHAASTGALRDTDDRMLELDCEVHQLPPHAEPATRRSSVRLRPSRAAPRW